MEMELVSWMIVTGISLGWIILKVIPGYAKAKSIGMDLMPHYGGVESAAKDRTRYGYARKGY